MVMATEIPQAERHAVRGQWRENSFNKRQITVRRRRCCIYSSDVTPAAIRGINLTLAAPSDVKGVGSGTFWALEHD